MKGGSQVKTEISNYQADATEFREPESIRQIVQLVRDYRCCTILGPLYSHKSTLLEHVRDEIATALKRSTIVVSIKAVRCVLSGGSYDVSEFLRDFGIQVASQFEESLRGEMIQRMATIKDEFDLSKRLAYCQLALDSDLVLLVDHLESARLRSLEALLRVLRQFFMQGQSRSTKRPVVVAASSHRVASLSLGAGSPFNIAIPFIVRDLTLSESKRWISYLARKRNRRISNAGVDRLRHAAGGDRYLLRELFVYSTEISNKSVIGVKDINAAVARFETNIDSYAPIRATIRTIEDNPSLLITLLGLLRPEEKSRDPLLRTSSSVDDINLSGGMSCDRELSPDSLRLRNEIYRDRLTKYFTPPKAAEVLAHNRRWDHAIRHLAQFPEHFSYLQEIVLRAVSSSSSYEEAAQYIDYFLAARFGLNKFAIFIRDKDESVTHRGLQKRISYRLMEDSLSKESSNTQKGFTAQKGKDPGGNEFHLITLGEIGNRLLSLAIYNLQTGEEEETPELSRFITEAVNCLSRLRTDLERIGSYARDVSVWSQVSGLLDPDRYLEEIIKAAMQVVMATKGSLYLWDFERNKLIVRAQSGFSEELVDLVQFNKGEGFAGWVFQNRKPVILDNVWADERMKRFEHQEIEDLKAAICVPLQVWDHVFGVLCLDTTEPGRRFTNEDLSNLVAFADHAVQVILSDRLRQEFYNLSMVLNRHDVDEAKIFRFAVGSILRIFGAAAASMLLLRDTDDPRYSIAQKPSLVEAEGLSANYKEGLAPRHDGLTHRVLESKLPQLVSNPDVPPGINPRALADGIKAQLCVPLKQDDEISGVLFVHYDTPHEFAEAEIRMMTLFANQVSLAISNVNQRKELELTDKVAWMGLKWPDLGHDFTQSVGSFENSLKDLISRTRPGSKEQAAMKAILDRVAQLKEQLLKIVADPYDHKPEWVNLSELLENQLKQYLQVFPDVKLNFECGACPQVNVDPRWFEIIVKNLVTNSIKAMETEHQKVLSVKCVSHGTRVTVTVSNTGVPIPEHMRPLIFMEPVFNESKRRFGIGLFVTARIISRYKGRIWIDRTAVDPTIAFSLPIGRTKS